MIDKIGRAALFAKNHFKTAVNSAKELKGKTLYKAKGFKNKAVAKRTQSVVVEAKKRKRKGWSKQHRRGGIAKARRAIARREEETKGAAKESYE